MSSGKRVVLLYSQPLHSVGKWFLMVTDEIRKELHDRGYHFELVLDLRLRRQRPDPVLRTLVQQYRADHWILASLPLLVQKWFQRRPLNAIVLGSSFSTIELPSVDMDHRAVVRHAAGMLLGLGHRKVVFLLQQSGAAGELAMVEGFNEAFRSLPNTTFRIIRHSTDANEIRSRLRTLFARASRPTALLVSDPLDALVVLTHLLNCGFRVPRDVSLISQAAEDFFEKIEPSPARYELDPTKCARPLCRLIKTPALKRAPIRLIPRLIYGSTLGPPAK